MFEIDEYNIILIKIHLLNHTTQLYSISEIMYINLHTSTHFCCIILNHNSMKNNIHIKIYHKNINKYIIKEWRAKISFNMKDCIFFNKIIASVYNKLRLNCYNNSKSISIDINESFLFINYLKFYRINIQMNKELYNNLLNKLITECCNWKNIYKIIDSYEKYQLNNRLSNIVTNRNIKENNKEDSFKEIQKNDDEVEKILSINMKIMK